MHVEGQQNVKLSNLFSNLRFIRSCLPQQFVCYFFVLVLSCGIGIPNKIQTSFEHCFRLLSGKYEAEAARLSSNN